MVGDGKRKIPISAESSVGQFVLSGLGEEMRRGLNGAENGKTMKVGKARQDQDTTLQHETRHADERAHDSSTLEAACSYENRT